MKQCLSYLLIFILLGLSCKPKPEKKENLEQREATEEAETKKQGDWITLFDGTSFDGWHVYPGKEVPGAWRNR